MNNTNIILNPKRNIKINFSSFWSDFNIENNFITEILKKHFDITITENPDFLFYSVYNDEYENYKDCIKIFYTGEIISPDFSVCDYAIGFDYINFEDRYLRWNAAWPKDIKFQYRSNISNELANRRFCNFIYSNENNGKGAIIRKNFCKDLSKYKKVDCPGSVLNNMKKAITPRKRNWVQGKIDFIRNYKFTIAFENDTKNGYITEKIFQPLQTYSIPIYWGDPLINKMVNPNSFINCHDFKSFDEVIEYIIYLDNNDKAYLDILTQPPMQPSYNYNKNQELESFLLNIINKGNTPYIKDLNGLWNRKNKQITYFKKKLAENLQEQKKFKEAEKLIREILFNGIEQKWAYIQLNKIYTLLNKKETIVNELYNTIKKNPTNYQISDITIQILRQQGELKEAEKIAQDVIEKEPFCIWAYMHLSYIATARKEFEKALHYAQKAVEIDHTNAYNIHHIACMQLQLNNMEEAEKYAHQALEHNTQIGQIYYTLSSIYIRKKNTNLALDFLLKAIKVSPTRNDFLVTFIKTAKENKDCKKSIDILNHSIKEYPHQLQLKDALIEVLRKHGNLEKAEKIANEIIDKNPSLAWPYMHLCYIASTRKDLKSALNYVHKAINIEPNNAYYIHHVACILLNENFLEQAEFYAQKALEVNPKIGQIYYTLSNIYKLRNSIPEAIKFIEKACEKEPKRENFKKELDNLRKISL